MPGQEDPLGEGTLRPPNRFGLSPAAQIALNLPAIYYLFDARIGRQSGAAGNLTPAFLPGNPRSLQSLLAKNTTEATRVNTHKIHNRLVGCVSGLLLTTKGLACLLLFKIAVLISSGSLCYSATYAADGLLIRMCQKMQSDLLPEILRVQPQITNFCFL